jgi:hypothetical protein
MMRRALTVVIAVIGSLRLLVVVLVAGAPGAMRRRAHIAFTQHSADTCTPPGYNWLAAEPGRSVA